MAISKLLLISLLLLLHLHLAQSDHQTQVNANEEVKYASGKIDCGSACSARCKLSSRQRLCNRACGTCCTRCNCVPPGTSGNHQSCPCYATMTTHGGRLKCP
ncbi:Gibberellin-regulated family protein [Euphorbia peplus]|nr:Gibberellin-regulated family protein [Euphorbia peplus]